MNSPVVKLLAVLTGVGVFFGGAYLVRQQLGIEITQESLRSYVDAMGPLAPVIFVAAVALRWVLAIPSALILTVGGAVFGVTLGTLYGALGMTIMGLAQYILVQIAGADALRARVPARFMGALEAARSWRGALVYARIIAIVYALLAIAGLLPAVQTGFGLIPLYAKDVWLHGLIALGGLYFGWAARGADRL